MDGGGSRLDGGGDGGRWVGGGVGRVGGRGAKSWPEERVVIWTTRAGVAAEERAAWKGGMAWRREGGGVPVRQLRVAALTRGSGAAALARRPRVPEQTLSPEGGGRERGGRGGAD